MRKPSSHPTLFPALPEEPAPRPIPKRAPRPPAMPAPQPAKAAAAPAAKPAKTAAAPKAITPAKPVKIAAAPKPAKAAAAPKPVKTTLAPKRAKTIPVQAAAPTPPTPVRVVSETNGAGGQAWRMTSRYAIAYIKDAALAGELLATDARHLAKIAMAVYYDRKGKAFAWQVRFDAARWDEVVRRLA